MNICEGDRARIIDPRHAWFGDIGTVKGLMNDGHVWLKLDCGPVHRILRLDQLEPA